MIVTAHQPNYLPGLNVIEKIESADAVIWLDEVLFSPGGWTNRNRMPDGSWLTVPIETRAGFKPINRVRISNHRDWQRRHERTLRQHYGDAADDICFEIRRPFRLLITLALACLRLLTPETLDRWHFQSHLDGGHAVTVVSDDHMALAPISKRIAMMVAEIGGTTYLSGPSGFRYLDETPFHELGIDVRYWEHSGTSDCAMSRLESRDGLWG